MKGIYRILALAVFTLLALSLATPSRAAADPEFYIRTDRASYVPGDTGVLFITIRNAGDQAFTIKNITINYPWMFFINDHWEGNVTIPNINQAIASGGAVYNTQQTFTIPTDGRAYRFSSGTVRVGTDIGGGGGGSYRSSSFTVAMSAPTYTPLEIGTSIFSIILIGIMAIATVLLFMVNQALRRTRPPTTH